MSKGFNGSMLGLFEFNYEKSVPDSGVVTVDCWYALYLALVWAPTEQTMGSVQRIFYYHVPSAWTAFLLFFINFGASIFYLIGRKAAADIVALVRPRWAWFSVRWCW